MNLVVVDQVADLCGMTLRVAEHECFFVVADVLHELPFGLVSILFQIVCLVEGK